jgi:hypothetical protein
MCANSRLPGTFARAGVKPTVLGSDGKSSPREDFPPGISDPALGGRRSRHARAHPRRTVARAVRADRRTPRPQSRPRRRRSPDPHALLLRPARRRDPLPQHLGPGEPHKCLDDPDTPESASGLDRAHGPGTQPVHARASSFLCRRPHDGHFDTTRRFMGGLSLVAPLVQLRPALGS